MTFFLTHFQQGGTIRRLVACPQNPSELLIGTTKGVFRCSDANIPSPQVPFWNTTGLYYDDIRGLEYKPGSSQIVYASGTDIYKSTDGGSTWNSMTGAGTGLDILNLPNGFVETRINIAVTPANPDVLFAYIIGNETNNSNQLVGYIYKWDGISWTQLHYGTGSGISSYSDSWIAIAVSPVNENEVCYGTTMIYRNYDVSIQGSIWHNITNYGTANDANIHADVHSIVYEPNTATPRIYCSHHGGISYGDYEVSEQSEWHSISTGLVVNTIWSGDISEYNAEVYSIGCQDNSIYLNDENTCENKTIGDGFGVQIVYDSRIKDGIALFALGSLSSFYKYIYNSTTWDYQNPGALPTDPYENNISQTVPATFKVFTEPVSRKPVFGFKELNLRVSDNTSTNPPLWEVKSDLGVTIQEWHKKTIQEIDYCKSDPNYIYVSTIGIDFHPATEKFTVDYEVYKECEDMNIVVHDIKGQEVYRVQVHECIGEVEILTPANPGTYYIYIESCGEYLAIDKIVVLK